MKIKSKKDARIRRKYGVRKTVFGTPDMPRLSVFRSNKHMYAQIIDDVAGLTLAAMSTKSKSLRDDLLKVKTGNKKAAAAVGAALAKQAIQVGIKCVKFDRDGFRYHGRVKALADAAREAGLVF
jgi:large subunit ribosomal protein L18